MTSRDSSNQPTTVQQTARLPPLTAPFEPAIDKILSRYPQGPEGPIALFRTLAHSERILDKVGKSGLLDKGSPLSMIDREIIILRTSANCACSYEWGVHVAAFSGHVGLSDAQIAATYTRYKHQEESPWDTKQTALINLADELSDDKTISDLVWQSLTIHFDKAQILELILLVGFYHSIAFLNNSLRVQQEPGTPELPKAG